MTERSASIHRQTSETDVRLLLDLDGSGQHDITTGVGFLDHMLRHVAVHGLFDLTVSANGDLEIDAHHTIEDVAIVLGQALDRTLAERAGIQRMGSAFVPMDEALAFVAVDLSGRSYSVIQAEWHGQTIGQMPTTLVPHFLETVAVQARMNLHARVEYGRDDHHQAEALFKALGRALRTAVAIDARRPGIASTKGTLMS
jgi:imidazoleglycerol-phosphate dehydratase